MKDLSFTFQNDTPKPCRSLLRIRKKKYKTIRQCHEKKGNKKLGMWNLIETTRYISFIKDNLPKLQNEQIRRKQRVFSLMATKIGSRSSVQCRSHHQKMAQVYGSSLDIIEHYEGKVIPYYQAQLKHWNDSIKPQKPILPVVNFCVMYQTSNSIRLELTASEIQSY